MRRPAGPRPAILSPAFVLLVLCAVALPPVEYRGGGEHTHAHAVVQLWDDAADGALDHHHAETGGVAHGGVAEAPPDVPRLTALAAAEQATPTLVVAAASLLAIVVSIRVRLAWPPAAVPVGVMVAPEPPPPRRVAAFA